MQILKMTDTAISEEHLYLFFPSLLEIYQTFFSSSKMSESECSEEGH